MDELDQSSQTQDDEAYANEARRCRRLNQHERYAVRRWWQRLVLSEREAKRRELPPPWPRGVRAILRRCESPDAAVLTEGFRRLWQMLDDDLELAAGKRPRRRDMQAWTCVALVAAELGIDVPGARPAQAFAAQRRETGKPKVSELRFQQLQQSHSHAELVRRMRRALAMTGNGEISVVNLADDILLWCDEHNVAGQVLARQIEDRIAFRWANDYFSTLGRYTGKD